MLDAYVFYFTPNIGTKITRIPFPLPALNTPIPLSPWFPAGVLNMNGRRDSLFGSLCLMVYPSLCIVWRTMYFRIFGGEVFFLIPASLLFGLLCCSAFPAFALFLLLCFSASLVFYFFFFSSFSASLLLSLLSFCVSVFCFSCFAFLLFCFCAFLLLLFFLQSCVFAAPLPAPLLPASLFLIFLLHPVCILNETVNEP